MDKWTDDILGNGYEAMTVEHEADYSGPVASTVVRRRAEEPARRAVLYVHGFSDYFLQDEMGLEFNSHGYNFYAVDLRKYGRSHRPGQKLFQVRSIDEYFDDINSALGIVAAEDNNETVLLGHSTGGLTASLYMARRHDCRVRALILNSPFLDWNLPQLKRLIIPMLSFTGRWYPNLRVPQPKDTRYARSLRRGLEGEWTYSTEWKPDQMPDVDAGWIRAIDRAQRELRRGADIGVPILLLTSALSARQQDPMEVFRRSDGVLDVDRIRRTARCLGSDVTAKTISGGLHDLALSAPSVRRKYYDTIFTFLSKKLTQQKN